MTRYDGNHLVDRDTLWRYSIFLFCSLAPFQQFVNLLFVLSPFKDLEEKLKKLEKTHLYKEVKYEYKKIKVIFAGITL